LAKPVSLSLFEIVKTIKTKSISIICKKIIIGFGNVSNKSKNNKIDLNKTLYLKTAKIENE
tara:strand:- start:56 stop:238 length:183 start_codon:yes stop_codon:yes gene_type:complete